MASSEATRDLCPIHHAVFAEIAEALFRFIALISLPYESGAPRMAQSKAPFRVSISR
jgi:hypothetical protein